MTTTKAAGLNPNFLLAAISAGLVPIVLIAALLAGTSFLLAGAMSSGFAGISIVAWRTGGSMAHSLSAVGLIGQAISLTAALSGHPWHLDSHMMFFALMAALIVLVDVRALLVGAGLVVLHHLSLSVVMPDLIYPDAGLLVNIKRTLFHGAILAMETAALVYTVVVRQRQTKKVKAQQETVAQAAEEAERARAAAETALAEADAQKAELSKAIEASEAARLEAARQSEEAAKLRQASERAEAAKRAQQEEIHVAQRNVVDALGQGLGQLADGNISVRLDTPFAAEFEDLRRDFNLAAGKLATVLSTVSGYAQEVNQESSNIAQAALDMSKRTEHQAATLAETATSIEELAKAVNASAAAASDAAKSSGEAHERATDGGEIVQKAISAMSRIEDSSNEIAKINGVIEDIAFQTNLLALNAGVEAARAGDAGRGFAVVASEVRGLARRSSDAVRDISALIEESGRQVSSGVSLVNKTGEALSVIVEQVKEITDRVGRIAEASTEQSVGFSEINKSVSDLDKVTQRNAAMFEETTAASTSLQSIASELRNAMGAFDTEREPHAPIAKAG